MNRAAVIKEIGYILTEFTDKHQPQYSEKVAANYPDKILMCYNCHTAGQMFREIKRSVAFSRRMKQLHIWKPNIALSKLKTEVVITVRFLGMVEH